MINRTLWFSLLLTIFSCIYSPFTCNAFSPMGMGQDQDFMKELEEANRAIEEWLSTLSPEEQADFNRQVEEVAKSFENMNEEDFQKFIDDMFADEPMTEPNPFAEVTPQLIEAEAVEVILSAEDKKKVETALAILDDVIKQSNLFMVIVNSSADAPESINRWAAKGDIANWQEGANWDSFKQELESFINKLYRAEEQDLTTKKYKYLLELIADEGLYNNLIQLQTELKKLLPVINIPEFAIQKLSAESKDTLKAIMNKYTESFYLLGIPAALDALFQKYAPEEEKIKLSEEAATKRAADVARAPRTPAGVASAGTEPYDDYGSDYGYGDYGYGSGYGDYGYDGGYRGGYGDYGYGDYGSDYGSGSRAGRGGGSGGGMGGGDDTGSSGRGESAGESTKDKDKKKKKKKEDVTLNFEIERILGNMRTNLEDIKQEITEDDDRKPKLASLVEHIKGEDSVDESLAQTVLPTIVDKKIESLTEDLKKITKKSLDAKTLSHYQKEVDKLFDTYKKPLTALHDATKQFITTEELEKLTKAGHKKEDIKETPVSEVAKEKQWAYFGGDDALLEGDEAIALREKITSRVSLFDIKKNIDELLQARDAFTKTKQAAPAPVIKEEEPAE